MKDRSRLAIGISLIVVAAMIAAGPFLLSGIFIKIPHDPKSFCIPKLKEIEAIKSDWAIVCRKGTNDTATEDDLFGLGKYMREKPACPAGGIYAVGSLNQKPRCSIPGHTI